MLIKIDSNGWGVICVSNGDDLRVSWIQILGSWLKKVTWIHAFFSFFKDSVDTIILCSLLTYRWEIITFVDFLFLVAQWHILKFYFHIYSEWRRLKELLCVLASTSGMLARIAHGAVSFKSVVLLCLYIQISCGWIEWGLFFLVWANA